MTFDRRISLITLGVSDLARSTAFYEALGWTRSSASQPGITFIGLKGTVLALFPASDLAHDADQQAGPGPDQFRGVTLAHNLDSREAVDAAMAHALSCGARLVKPPQPVFWGGYSGYFADPDGHFWELAHNPFMPLDGDGHLTLPE